MAEDFPEWGEVAAQFLAENLPKAFDRPGWNDKASTAYQIGCMGLVRLGYAVSTEWGAIPKARPEHPEILPRWDDICISVLWLAEQQNLLSYGMPDGSLPPRSVGNGFVVVELDAPPPPGPNIAARYGLGPAFCQPEVMQILERLGLVFDGGWTEDSEFVLWRTSPMAWALDFVSDERFLAAVEEAVATIPDDIATEISELVVIKEEQVDELITLHAEKIAEAREKYGPKARLGSVPSKEQAQRSLEFSRRNALDWLFFRHWRIDDGWLSEDQAKSALEVFHDRLAISMRKSVLQHMHPAKSQFFQ